MKTTFKILVALFALIVFAASNSLAASGLQPTAWAGGKTNCAVDATNTYSGVVWVAKDSQYLGLQVSYVNPIASTNSRTMSVSSSIDGVTWRTNATTYNVASTAKGQFITNWTIDTGGIPFWKPYQFIVGKDEGTTNYVTNITVTAFTKGR